MKITERLEALDIFRGLTVALMILVNNPGSIRTYALLEHSKWNGCTPTDLVFPFFLFCVGTAMWFSFKKYNHTLNREVSYKILKRTVFIFLIGLFLNALPNFDMGNLRILGVLQRIALAYCIGSFIVLLFGFKRIVTALIFILIGYWSILCCGGGGLLTLEENVVRTLDLAILGANHVYHGYGIPFDPEGILSTIPSIGNILVGYLVGQYIDQSTDKRKCIGKLSIYGISCVVIALIWNSVLPINKPIWTSSYVMITCGLAMIVLSILIWIIDVKGAKKWSYPFKAFGMNPLALYVGSELLAIFMFAIPMGVNMSLKEWIYQNIFVSWAGDNCNTSLLFGLTFILVMGVLAIVLYRKKIFIKL